MLPFRLSSASNIFTKVVRVLVRFWQTHGVRITVNLDGGFSSACHYACRRAASMFLKSSLLSTGFLSNDSQSVWQPTPCLAWLGLCIDLSSRNISTTPERTFNDEHVIHTIHAQYLFSTVGKLACFVARIISRGFVFGNNTIIMNR